MGLAINRIAFGAGLLLVPSRAGRSWLGPAAQRRSTQVFARGLGARDLALGAGALLALQRGEPAQRWFQGQLISDATDFVATLAAGRRIPPAPRLFALAVAGGSTAVAAACSLPSADEREEER